MIPFKMLEVSRDKWDHLNGNPNSDLIKVFKSDRFLVQIRKHKDSVRLSINKVKYTIVNGNPIWHDAITWDELQEIKNQCGYENFWLCEYYPPKDSVVNVANIRHLWVMDKEPENRLDKVNNL